jgi:aerobic carbon-monoxide dehydrogenase large subunit
MLDGFEGSSNAMSIVPQSGSIQWIGKPLRRLEDDRLLRGEARFTDDISIANQAHAWFVRSPHPHARIRSISCDAARAMPGVLAVLTGADARDDGLQSMPFMHLHTRRDGSPIVAAPRMALTHDVARFVGDAVAMVIAESRNVAKDAAELIDIDYEPLPAVVDLEDSGHGDAPPVWAPAFTGQHGNIAAFYRMGDAAAVDEAFGKAAHITRIRVVNNRVIAHPLEVRGAIGEYDAAGQTFTIHAPVQGVHRARTDAAVALGVAEDRVRVVVEDLGGGFGARAYGFPENAAVAWAAKRVGRPVKWLADRTELFLCDVHGRDQLWDAELALDATHRFVAMRVRTLANVGAYLSFYGAAVPAMSGARAINGCYDIPLVDHEVRMLFTHTAPVDAYRGAGRPETGYLVERLVHKTALELGIDPVELKRRNFVRPEQMPYRNPVDWTYECGDFDALLRKAMDAIDWSGFEARQAESATRGRLRGRGIANYIEVTGSGLLTEEVDFAVRADGSVRIVCGTQSMGQGLWTSFAQVAAEKLQIDPGRVTIFEGDSAIVRSGGGSGGSRSLQVGGNAVLAGAMAVVRRGRELAARKLEAAAGDIEYAAGVYSIAGTDRSVSLFALAADEPGHEIKLSAAATASGQTWPNGCQAAEVEIDRDTGSVHLVRMVAVDDIGTVINPMIAHGQIHGGIVQGIGQALLENVVYDRETGQLLTGSFLDYAMPRASHIPPLSTQFDESLPTAFNMLGAKGVGESGTHGAIPAVVNAVVDALRPYGIMHLDMPLTSEKIWRAIDNRAL